MSRAPAHEGRRAAGRCIILAILMAGLCARSTALAADKPEKSPWDLKMFRFEFDNDSFLGSDDAFTAGWSFQIHSKLMDQWNPTYAGWIGKIPGLGDDGHGRRIVRWAYGLSQIIVSPEDITIAAPQPNDAPWAGMAGVTGTWSSYDHQRLGAIQVYLGCMGPCSQAQDVQTYFHDNLGLGDHPEGWGNQLSNKALANLNYEYRHKLYSPDVTKYQRGRFTHDLAAGGMAAVGNLTTRASAEVEYRFGWGLPLGFTKIPDPPGIGMVLDPVYLDPEKPVVDLKQWRWYFNLVGRYAYITYLAPAEGGPTESGYNHPEIRPYPGEEEVLVGLHMTRVPFGLHLTYYRYFDTSNDITAKLDWVNFSLEFRF